jgi:hypothetical protein
MTAKVGIDATKPLGKTDSYEKARIPGIEKINIEEYLSATSEKT